MGQRKYRSDLMTCRMLHAVSFFLQWKPDCKLNCASERRRQMQCDSPPLKGTKTCLTSMWHCMEYLQFRVSEKTGPNTNVRNGLAWRKTLKVLVSDCVLLRKTHLHVEEGQRDTPFVKVFRSRTSNQSERVKVWGGSSQLSVNFWSTTPLTPRLLGFTMADSLASKHRAGRRRGVGVSISLTSRRCILKL